MSRTRCPHCRQPTITTIDNNPAGLPIVLHPHPTSRLHALTTIANGHRAVIADSDGDWRHPSTSYWVLDAWRIPNTNLEHRPHYVEHQCGATPPPPDPPTPPPACACDWCQRTREDTP